MSISRTTIFVGFSTGIKILSGLVINKYISIISGPAGLVVVGQLQNFLSIINMIGTGGVQNGVTALIAKEPENRDKVLKVVQSAFFVSVFFSFLILSICTIFPNVISASIFKNDNHNALIRLAGVSVFFFVFNNFSLAIINGF